MNETLESSTKQYPDNVKNLRNTEFKHLQNSTYLDHAGSGVYAKSQLDGYFEDLQGNFYGNPHSKNPCSLRTENAIDQVRETILNFFNVSSDSYSCIFTKNATEALRIVGGNFLWGINSKFVYLEDNHTSVVGLRSFAKAKHVPVYCMTKPSTTTKSYHLSCGYNIVKVCHDFKLNHHGKLDKSPCLFAYPAQSNFSGKKYPLKWSDIVHRDLDSYFNDEFSNDKSLNRCHVTHQWFTVCDAASYVSTSHLDLNENELDFIPISFYKLFGFPTGVGALLVKKSAEQCLVKQYFGGGSVRGWLATEDFNLPRFDFYELFEDGTLSFLDIIAVQQGFNFFKKLKIQSMLCVQKYTFGLIKIMFTKMASLKHYNGAPLVEIYTTTNYESPTSQGPIIAFNLLDHTGQCIGFNKVLELAGSQNISLRSGCFCNIGACARFMDISVDLLKEAFQSGKHSCGDSVDLIEGKPIGALRASLGYNSHLEDVEKFTSFLEACFLVKNPVNHIQKLPPTSAHVILNEIFLYPVKSCRGMSVNSWKITRTGLLYDRYWMISDDKNVVMTLKRNTKLSLIQPKVEIDTGTLTLEYMGNDIKMTRFKCLFKNYSKNSTSNVVSFKMFNEVSYGVNCGKEASEWLTKVIGTKCNLFQLFQNQNGARSDVSLVNKSQYLLINETSVNHLAKIIETMGEIKNATAFDITGLKHHFRANFIISGAEIFAEDYWKQMQTQNIDFFTADVCGRCSLISVDPFTGERFKEPLKSLFVHLKRKTFGIYMNSFVDDIVIKTGHLISIVQ